MKINWSGRSHNYSNKELTFLRNVIKKADPLTQGKYLKLFEKSFAKYIKVDNKKVFALSSAAAALEIIAALLKLKKGDEIIIPAHTYCASAIPFLRNGARIVWADIDFDTRVIDFQDVQKKISKKTKAIVVVHLYGYACDISPFVKICKKKKIKLIEDCAQASGAELNNKKVGTYGDFSCYSFHSQKNITTLGEGGMIYVKNNLLAKKVKGLRHNGHCDFNFKRKNYWQPAMGNLDLDIKDQLPFKFTLSEVQCASGILMLKRLDKLNKKRIKRAKKFVNSLRNFKNLIFNKSFEKRRHVYHLLSAYYKPHKSSNRDNLISIMFNKFKIKCAVQYYPLYRYSLFKKINKNNKICKNTDKFYDNMISFPFHEWMSDKEFNYLINSTKKSLKILEK